MRHLFCPLCGTELVDHPAGDDGLVPYCAECKKCFFDSFSTCIIVLVYNELGEVALLRQSPRDGRPAPYMGLVAGYIVPGETAEQAARREVHEELGLELETLEYHSSLWFDKREQLMLGYLGFAQKAALHISDEIAEAEWIDAKGAAGKIRPPSPDSAANMLLSAFLAQPEDRDIGRYGLGTPYAEQLSS